MDDLTGQHALVTGGGTGIGLAIAQMLQAQGAEVTITGRRADVLEAAGDQFHPVAMDVNDETATRSAIARSRMDRGPISICVANAGIAEGGPFDTVTLADWRRMMSINLDGAFVTMQACLATLPHDHWGRYIAISSIAGLRGLRGAVPYTVSKHGLIGLVRGLSEEYMRRPVTFNAICPGYVETDIVTRQVPLIAKRDGISEDAARAILAGGNRHKSLLHVEEIAATARYLVGFGSNSVNGQTLTIVGGQL